MSNIVYPSPDELLSHKFLNKYENSQPNWGFHGLGYLIYKRTYARLKENNILEEWHETIERCIKGAQKIGAKYSVEEAERLYDYLFNFKVSFSGRSLWQLGTPLVDEVGMDSLANCWLTKISEIEDFIFVITESMLGGGVGPVVSKEFTHELPRVKEGVKCTLKKSNDADFIVPDSKEGWAELWNKILNAYLLTGKSLTYSTICIRPKGSLIKRFGGKAPGEEPLIQAAQLICQILEYRAGKKLRTQDVCDIITVGGQMVKSGGVRRTALILQGDVDDTAFSLLKRWDLGNIPNHRSNSNNSFLCSYFEHLSDKYWDSFKNDGERYGLINLSLCKKFGRLGEDSFSGFDLKNENIIGVNPCGEATLEDKECCNLAQLPLNILSSKEEALDAAILIYKTQKAIAAGQYLNSQTNKIVHKNMRLGLSLTGVCQKPLPIVKEWSDYIYRGLRKFDKEWSKLNGYPQSIRLTTIQPDGTKSLLYGACPGGHPGFSRFHIRRVRFSSNDNLLNLIKECGFNMEPEILFDGSFNRDITVVDFPCKFDDGTLFAEDMGAVKQLELVKVLQTCWADQAVSVTIYYKDEEIPDIKKWMKENYNDSIKTVSFLKHQNHGFKQAPLEKISKIEYEEMIKNIKPINYLLTGQDMGGQEIISDNCANGACPVK